jgi:PAS domain S-box-containing protein
VGISRDVSDRRRAEEALRQSEARYRAVVEQSVEGIFLFDPDTGRILESNAALREMLGYSSEEPLGMTVYEIVAHDRREVEASLREDLRHRRRLAGERRYRRTDGTLVEVEVGMTVVLYQGKEALCSVVRDLTERKRLERELRHQAHLRPPDRTAQPHPVHGASRAGTGARARDRRPHGCAVPGSRRLQGGERPVGPRSWRPAAGGYSRSSAAEPPSRNTACQLGGDEFLVLLEDSTPALAEAVARRLLEELAAPFGPEGKGDVTRLTASAGVALA